MSKLLRTYALRVCLTQFEIMLASGTIYKNPLSKIYALLIESGKIDLGPYERWDRDLEHQISHADWAKASKFIVDISYNIVVRESYYKVCYWMAFDP